MRFFFTSVFILTSIISLGQNTTIDDLSKLYNSKDFKSVIEKTKPFIEQDPGNIDLNLLMGRSLTDLADFKNALPYLESVVKMDNANSWRKAWALGYLGTCYFILQDYTNSESSLNECIKLNATRNATNIATGQTLLFGFDGFYKTWKIVETDNFRFHFQNMSATEIEKYTSDREVAFKGINGFFKSTLPKKIDFYVWESRDDAMKVLKKNLGFANPGFCIIHTYYNQTIGHEMTHVISNYTSEITSKTRFINEGTSVCFDLSNNDNFKLVKDWLAANNKQIAIKDCWENGEKYSEEILYPLSGLFVKELLNKFGKEKFLEFFKNQTYGNAQLIFGVKLDAIIAEFEKKINI
jgi:tetratricopeptide (TPR) repeat protein